MIGPLLNAMRLQAQRASTDIQVSRVGIVTSYDPSTYSVRVQLLPEGILTGWMPLASPWAGDGWGFYAPPSINDLVDVHFVDGDLEAGIAVARLYNDIDLPLAVQSGELWIVHAKGSFFKLTNDGKVIFSDGNGASIELNGDGTITSVANAWNHTGDVNVTGNVNVSETLTATTDVIGGGKSLKTHPHLPGSFVAGSTPVTGNSGAPP